MSLPLKNILFILLLALSSIDSQSQIQISNFEYEVEVKRNVGVKYNYDLPGKFLLNVQPFREVHLLTPSTGEISDLLLNDSTKLKWVISKKGNIGVFRSSSLHDYIVQFDSLGYRIVDTVFSFNTFFRNEWQYEHNQDFIVYVDDYVVKKITSDGLTILGKNGSHEFALQATQNHWLVREETFFYYDGLKRKLREIEYYKYVSQLLLAHSGLYIYNPDDRTLYKIEVPAEPQEKIISKRLYQFDSSVESVIRTDTLFFSTDSMKFVVTQDSVVQKSENVINLTQPKQNKWSFMHDGLTVTVNKKYPNISNTIATFVTTNRDTIETETEVYHTKYEEFDCNVEVPNPIKKGNKTLLAPKNLLGSTLLLVDSETDTVTIRYLLPIKRQSDSIITCLSHDRGKHQKTLRRLYSLNLLTLETQEIVVSDINKLSPHDFTIDNKFLKIGMDKISYGKYLFSKKVKEDLKQKPTGLLDETFEYSLINGNLVKLNRGVFQEGVESTNGLIHMKDSTADKAYFKVFFDYANQKKLVIPTDSTHYYGYSTYPQLKVINATTILIASKEEVKLWDGNNTQPLLSGGSQYYLEFVGSELFVFELYVNSSSMLHIYHFNKNTLKLELAYTHTYKYKTQMIEANPIGSRMIEIRRRHQSEKILEWKGNKILEVAPFWQGRHFDWSEKKRNGDFTLVSGHEGSFFIYFNNNIAPVKFKEIVPRANRSISFPPNFAYIYGNFRVNKSIPNAALFKYNYSPKSLEYLDTKIKNIEVKDDFCIIEAYDSDGYLWFYLLNKNGAFKLNQKGFELAEFKLDSNGIYVAGSLVNNHPQIYFLPYSDKVKSNLNWRVLEDY